MSLCSISNPENARVVATTAQMASLLFSVPLDPVHDLGIFRSISPRPIGIWNLIQNPLFINWWRCEGVDPTKTRPSPQPLIPEISRAMQRVQGFQYKDLVAARCKSHLIQKVSEYERARTNSHSTRDADTESRINNDYTNSERSRITTTVSMICPFIRDT